MGVNDKLAATGYEGPQEVRCEQSPQLTCDHHYISHGVAEPKCWVRICSFCQHIAVEMSAPEVLGYAVLDGDGAVASKNYSDRDGAAERARLMNANPDQLWSWKDGPYHVVRIVRPAHDFPR